MTNDNYILVTETLLQLGMPTHVKGYAYMREALLLTLEQPETIASITKELYPNIAAKFQTTPIRVERAMRHAIGVLWEQGDEELLGNFYGGWIRKENKPTNSAFIAILSEKLRLKLEK